METKITIISSTFYPDIGPGAIRTTLMLDELIKLPNLSITLITQEPNRYNDHLVDDYLKKDYEYKNLKVIRHKNKKIFGIYKSKIYSYVIFFLNTLFSSEGKNSDILWATSSRFFTLLLAYFFSFNKKTQLYLDVRDLFLHNISEIYHSRIIRLPILFLTYIEKKIVSKAKINLISPGFNFYFDKYKVPYTSYYHGIPEIFYDHNYQISKKKKIWQNKSNKILYVGNIGEGQGLHIIVPDLAKQNPNLKITLIGDGKYRKHLLNKISKENLINIDLIKPLKQADLIKYYEETDFLFLNLNTYKSFKNVMPSKIYEYSIFQKPILYGTDGVSKDFISKNIDKSFFFEPNNAKSLNDILLSLLNKTMKIDRSKFINNSRYKNIIKNYSRFILKN